MAQSDPPSSPGARAASEPAFRLQPVFEAAAVDHMQLRALYAYWCRQRDGRRIPPRRAIVPRDIPRHLPFLIVAELLRADGLFRPLEIGAAAREFWNFYDASSGKSATTERFRLLTGLMTNLAANRLPVTMRSTITNDGTNDGGSHAFALIALPLAEDGERVDAALIETAFWPLPPVGGS